MKGEQEREMERNGEGKRKNEERGEGEQGREREKEGGKGRRKEDRERYRDALVCITRVRPCNFVKVETGRNLPPVLKIVTHTVQLCVDMSHCC